MNITDQNVISGSAPAVPGDGWHLFIKLDFNERLWTKHCTTGHLYV